MMKDNITYFENAGNTNFDAVISTVSEYLQTDESIKNIVIFAGKKASVISLYDKLFDYKHPIKISVATYSYGREFKSTNNETGEIDTIIPDVTTSEAKTQILELGMNYIQGGLPFEPIRSCTGDNATEMIISTFDLISKGLVHCVSAAIMAKENGYIEDNEKVIALSGDTAIVVTPTIRRNIFDGGFKIHKILCKPI